MLTLTLFLGLAAIGHALARWRRLPVVPILLVIGIALPLVGAGIERGEARRFVELGIAFLVFNAGIELNPQRFLHHTRQVLGVGLGQFVLIGYAGFQVAFWMGFGWTPSLYLGFAAAASSTLVVIGQLKASQQMFQPFGRLVTGVLLFQDALMIGIIVALTHVNGGAGSIFGSLGLFALLAALAGAVHVWLLPWVERLFHPDAETLLLLALAVLFLFLGAAHALGLPLIAGAFLAGFTLSVFPLNGLLRGLLSSLSEFFQALFFTALGSLVLFTSWWIPVQAIVFAGLVIVLTPVVVTCLAEWLGQSSRNALESGLLLAQTSEFSLVIGLVGVAAGHLDEAMFSVIALTAALTMMITPFLATDQVVWALLPFHPGHRKPIEYPKIEGHTLLIGFGSAGMWLVKDLHKAGHQVLVVDEDASVIAHCEKSRIACLRGEGTDPRLLQRAGIRAAQLVLVNLPRPMDAVKIVREAAGTRVIARVFEEADAARVQEAGGIPVSTAEAAFNHFYEWFEKTEERRPQQRGG